MTLETQRVDAQCKSVAMLADLGSGYRPAKALTSVSDLQAAWNDLLPLVSSMPGVLFPSKYADGHLDEDGLYGTQTQTATKNFLPPALASSLPKRAADIPIWYARNGNQVEAVCTPAPPVEPIPPGPQLPVIPTIPIETALRPDDVITIESPVVSPPPGPEPEPMPPIIAVSPPPVSHPVEVSEEPIVDAQIPTAEPIELEPVVIGPSAPSLLPAEPVSIPAVTLTAPPRKGGVGVLAVALVGVGVAGAAFFAMRSGRKRR